MTTPKLPMQPIVLAPDNVFRFRPNKIVSFLLDWATPRGIGMNELAMMQFDDDEREQFAQLIGYSISGYGELSYVSDESYDKANAAADKLRTKQ